MRPRLALTAGDPAGIGPEIAAKAWAAGERFVWIGDPRHLPRGTDWRAVAEGDGPGDAESLGEGLGEGLGVGWVQSSVTDLQVWSWSLNHSQARACTARLRRRASASARLSNSTPPASRT